MTRRIPRDHNYDTACPADVKAKITALENEAYLAGASDGQHEALRDRIVRDAQTARYNLERTIQTCIDAAVKAALDPDTKRTK